jgi:hypothetical protein
VGIDKAGFNSSQYQHKPEQNPLLIAIDNLIKDNYTLFTTANIIFEVKHWIELINKFKGGDSYDGILE